MFICSAFSLNMLTDFNVNVTIRPLTLQAAKALAKAENPESAVGHPDTAVIFSDQLDMKIPVNRATLKLGAGDSLIVGQYRGPRLPEGATALPPDATIEWCLVELMPSARGHLSPEVVAAVDRVVLRGHPLEREGVAVLTDDGTWLEAWPKRIQIGPVTLYLMRTYHKNGAQEAQYERRPGIEV